MYTYTIHVLSMMVHHFPNTNDTSDSMLRIKYNYAVSLRTFLVWAKCWNRVYFTYKCLRTKSFYTCYTTFRSTISWNSSEYSIEILSIMICHGNSRNILMCCIVTIINTAVLLVARFTADIYMSWVIIVSIPRLIFKKYQKKKKEENVYQCL